MSAFGSFSIKALYNKEEGCQIHSPVFYNGHIYANFNENDFLKGENKRQQRGLSCLDPKTGKIHWRTGAKPSFERGGLILADGKLYILDGETGILHMAKADPSGYRELGQVNILQDRKKKIWSPMALSNGKLVLRNQSVMKCLDLKAK